MNAGAYGGEISQKVVSVDYLDENGDLHTLSKEECEFSYRHSVFMKHKWFVVSASFLMDEGNPETMLEFMEDIMQRRKDKQPLDKPSAGSSFKRPEGYFAAALIDQCGLKGYSEGNVGVHSRQALVLINTTGNATGSEVIAFARKVQSAVADKFGIAIDTEVNIL